VPDGGEWLTSCPDHFTSGKELKYLLDRRLGGSESKTGCFAEE
jgi:hypothetical protein